MKFPLATEKKRKFVSETSRLRPILEPKAEFTSVESLDHAITLQ